MEVSIGIPAYNSERWLAEAIESALEQTWPDKEVIVVDDGSTDDTAQVCARFGTRIRYEYQPNRGGNAARNRILELSRGEWLQYLDADDYLKPEKIATQLGNCTNLAERDVLCSATIRETWRDGVRLESQTVPLAPGADLYERWLRWNMPQTGACLWRTAALRRIGGWDERLRRNQDTELHFRAFRNGFRYEVCGEPGAVWRSWSDQTISNRNKTQLFGQMGDLMVEFTRWLHEQGALTPGRERAGGELCFQMARDLATQDLQAAARLHQKCRRRGLIRLEPARAPWTYRLVYHPAGFKAAERVAMLLRRR